MSDSPAIAPDAQDAQDAQDAAAPESAAPEPPAPNAPAPDAPAPDALASKSAAPELPTPDAPAPNVSAHVAPAAPVPDAHRETELGYKDAASWVGRVLDERYRVNRQLGEGGMGAVFVAEHLALQKEVALKVVRAELAGNGDVAIRFAREAMATARFEHPHVASAIDYGSLPEGGAYFVMQLVRGRSLRAMLANDARMPWRRACELCAQVADALSEAKAAGIVHRDLKPDNILVEAREDGSELVKVLDFGIARVTPQGPRDPSTPGTGTAPEARELTRVGTVMGTPGYMPPEQAVGDRVDHRADLYALGVVLWECIAGRALWDAQDLSGIVGRQMTEQAPALRTLSDPSVPAELDTLIATLTARLPALRPDAPSEVRDTLRRLALLPSGQGFEAWLERARGMASVIAARARSERARFLALSPEARRTRMGQALAVLLSLTAVVALASFRDEQAPAASLEAQAPSEQPSQEVSAQPPEPKRAAPNEPSAPQPRSWFSPREVREVPVELEGSRTALLEGTTLRERRDAAKALLAYGAPDRIADPIRRIAEFEVAASCKTRKQAIKRLLEAPDPRFLRPILRRHEAPRSGCGFLSLEDCYSCIRRDLKKAVDELRAQGAEQPQ